MFKGKKPKSATVLQNGNIRLEFLSEDNKPQYIEVNDNVVKLYRNLTIRQKLSEVLAPLKRPGVSKFEVRSNETDAITTVSNEEILYFETPELEETEGITSERKALMRIISLSFEGENKWKLDDGESKIWVTILDEDFLSNVDNRIIGFAKGDTLEVIIRTNQKIVTTGLKTTHEIIKVLKIHPKPEQMSLFEVQPNASQKDD